MAGNPESESQQESTNSMEQLSPEDLIATISEQQTGSTKNREKQTSRDTDVDPIALERGQRFVPRGAFAAGGRNLSTRSLVTNGDVPLEAVLVNPQQATIEDGGDIFTAHPIESVANDKQTEKQRWTAQIWCRYCLAALCLLTVLVISILGIRILSQREGREEEDGNKVLYSHHGVFMGSRADCPVLPFTMPYVNFTLRCPGNNELVVHNKSISVMATNVPVDTSTWQVSVPLDSEGYVAFDCVRASSTPREKIDLSVTMEETVVQGCRAPIRAFALFLRRCGDRKIMTRSATDCGDASPDYGKGVCVNDEYENCYSECVVGVDDCSHAATCLPEVTAEDRTKCEETNDAQDPSFLDAIQPFVLDNFAAALQQFDSWRHGYNNTEDVPPWQD